MRRKLDAPLEPPPPVEPVIAAASLTLAPTVDVEIQMLPVSADARMREVEFGQPVFVQTSFKVDGEFVHPEDVVAVVTDDQARSLDVNVERADNVYRFSFLPDRSGYWYVGISTKGDYQAAAEERFKVKNRQSPL